ncbi:rod shape-determining protein MreD [Bacillus sp. FJAT-45350]|uniref:rod shape-determining protein MreD n=1 Tax=Bacillus sp. FJAT-45350 TaxID=2011014 RepID=UPI000BB6CA78|nr:rod shape-determining protein MreD [Bacillus sp. FJAT-45350]
MNRLVIPFIVFLLFVLEGTIFQVFAPENYNINWILVPRFVIVMIVIIGIFQGRIHGVLFGLGFGLLYDVVYTDMLGVYLFSMGLIGYLFSLSYKPVQRSFSLLVIISLVAVIGIEYFVFGMYLLLGMTQIPQEVFFFQRLLPTLILNLCFAAIIVWPLRKYLLYLIRYEKSLEDKL